METQSEEVAEIIGQGYIDVLEEQGSLDKRTGKEENNEVRTAYERRKEGDDSITLMLI